MAGGLIDGGASLYAYAKGEISGKELQAELTDTTIKSVSTVYFTKAVALTLGAANPFIPMAIYTAATYMVSCTRSILEQAKLNAEEADRMTAILKETTRLTREYHRQLNDFMQRYKARQKAQLNGLLNAFDVLANGDTQYERAVYAILTYSNQTGLALQHADFGTFKAAMCSDEEFVLKR